MARMITNMATNRRKKFNLFLRIGAVGDFIP